jgi:hypothetical protein
LPIHEPIHEPTGGYDMTEQQAQEMHDAVIYLERISSRAPGADTFNRLVHSLHVAMHLGEAGLTSYLEYSIIWLNERAGPLLRQQLEDAARAPEPEPSQPEPSRPNLHPTGKPEDILDMGQHFFQVDQLAELLRTGKFPTNPNQPE